MKKNFIYLLKALTWRLCGTFATFVITYVLTGELKLAGIISFGEFIAKIIAYYIHEKVWAKIEELIIKSNK